MCNYKILQDAKIDVKFVKTQPLLTDFSFVHPKYNKHKALKNLSLLFETHKLLVFSADYISL